MPVDIAHGLAVTDQHDPRRGPVGRGKNCEHPGDVAGRTPPWLPRRTRSRQVADEVLELAQRPAFDHVSQSAAYSPTMESPDPRGRAVRDSANRRVVPWPGGLRGPRRPMRDSCCVVAEQHDARTRRDLIAPALVKLRQRMPVVGVAVHPDDICLQVDAGPPPRRGRRRPRRTVSPRRSRRRRRSFAPWRTGRKWRTPGAA